MSPRVPGMECRGYDRLRRNKRRERPSGRATPQGTAKAAGSVTARHRSLGETPLRFSPTVWTTASVLRVAAVHDGASSTCRPIEVELRTTSLGVVNRSVWIAGGAVFGLTFGSYLALWSQAPLPLFAQSGLLVGAAAAAILRELWQPAHLRGPDTA